MICRAALVYRLVLLLVMVAVVMVVAVVMEARVVMVLAVLRVPVPMEARVVMETGVVMLLVGRRVRFSFQRLRLVLLNAGRVFRWMTISDARESFVDASRVRLNRRRVRRQPGRSHRQTDRTLTRRITELQIAVDRTLL